MRRAALAALVAVLGMAWAIPSASAHAALDRSEPAPGAALDAPPDAVVLHFTERPDPGLSSVHVFDGSGKARERGAVEAVPGDSRAVRVALPTLPEGVYTVNWRTTSAVDGHTTVGAFAFGVGTTPDISAAKTTVSRNPTPTPAGIAGRWLLYVGLTLLVGAAAVRLLAPAPATEWPSGIILLAAAVATFGLAINVADQAAVAHAGFGTYVRSRAGRPIRVEMIAAVLTLVAAVAWRLKPGRVATVAVGATALFAMFARVDAGHAAASSDPWLTVGLQTLHFAAVGAWVGGLPFLVLGVRRAPELARRFSTMATVGLAVVVATGTARAIDEVGGWKRLFDAAFGQALLVKLALVAVLVALGLLSRRRLADGDRVRRTARAEVVVAVGVLVATAVLTGIAPSSARRSAASAPAAVVASGSDFATTTRVRIKATPGRAGPNRFEVRVADYDSGAPLDATAVSLRFQPLDRAGVAPSTLELRRRGDDWIGQGLNLASDGRWRITVSIDRAAGGLEVPVELETKLPPQTVDAQRTPGLPTIYTVTSAGRKVQVYFDPEKPGPNELHFTFVNATGEEDVAELAATIRAPGAKAAEPLEARRLDKGHFVGDVEVRPGTYRLTITRTLTDGSTASFRLSIPVR